MKKPINKKINIRDIPSLDQGTTDKLSLPFNNTLDQIKPVEPSNKIKPVNKNILHILSMKKNPLSAQNVKFIVDEENGVRDALRQGKLKFSDLDNSKKLRNGK